MAATTKEQLTEDEARFQKAIGAEVERRARAAREERAAARDIAALCVEARKAGVTMARLAEFVRVLDKTDGGDGPLKLRPVTRQAVDLLVANFEGRVRDPSRSRHHRRADSNGTDASSAIKLEAFK